MPGDGYTKGGSLRWWMMINFLSLVSVFMQLYVQAVSEE